MLKSGNSSYSLGNSNLLLTDILHVPEIEKNLLSVRKLCADNNILVTFDSSAVYIKDRATNKNLWTGGVAEGLYQLHLGDEESSKANLVTKVPISNLAFQIWSLQRKDDNQISERFKFTNLFDVHEQM